MLEMFKGFSRTTPIASYQLLRCLTHDAPPRAKHERPKTGGQVKDRDSRE
jgi:hypothetical protein